ncbi:hypothetical protein GGR56DRAFT_617840 [Xylariaceae sp. FL0804]|nr:hypothetical protein GGR56DRAFT_617840 [Xylariaceae sp. FL0804]
MDDFSDDDLFALNANALQELENSAIQFTQAQRRDDDTEYAFEDDDLDDTIVQDALQATSALPPPERPVSHPAAPPQGSWGPVPIPASRFRPPPVAAAARPPVAQPAAPRTSQHIAPPRPPPSYSQVPRPPPPLPRPPAPIPSRYTPTQAPRQSGVPTHELAALQAQIQDLKSRLTTKDGEISIVRKRLDKSREDHERELHAIKKQAAEQLARHERTVEAAKAAQQSAATELEFVRRDLRDEVDRTKRRDVGGGTPKKNAAARSWGVADGFDDVEMAGSPSRGQRGKNAGPVASAVAEPPARLTRTPTKPKRKRPAVDSPVMALETHSEDVVMLDDIGPVGHDPSQASAAPLGAPPFDYTKVILNHSAGHGRPLTFESLAAYVLPSRRPDSLASILFHKLATGGDSEDPMRLPIDFCEQVIQLWDDCKKEKCLEPITELVSLVLFTLQLHTIAIAPYIAPSLLPVAMDSCYEVAIPRFHNPQPGEPTDEDFIKFRENISTTQVLSLLYLTALGCAASDPVGGGLTSPAIDFWSEVHPQFVLMLLNQKQPLGDFLATLRLLCTSVFPDSIGPIDPDKTPELVAQSLIEKLSLYLAETPRWEMDELELRNVRYAVLQTLAAFARSPYGLVQLARYDGLIPRLVTLLSSSIDELYDTDMCYDPPTATGTGPGAMLQSLVADTMLLLHMMVTNPLTADVVDVATKLAKVTGGSQKYLLSLGRLNFGDDLVSEETAELAHELLELAVTSEAGEELGVFFGG